MKHPGISPQTSAAVNESVVTATLQRSLSVRSHVHQDSLFLHCSRATIYFIFPYLFSDEIIYLLAPLFKQAQASY